MDDKRILELAQAAVELDELDAASAEQQPISAAARTAAVRRLRWWMMGAGVAAAAALALVVLLPPDLTINELAVTVPAQRNLDSKIKIDLALSRPAYIRIVFVDERFERWVMPLDEDQAVYVKRIGEEVTIRGDLHPNPTDPRGSAEAILVMTIASAEPTPSADDLLAAIPDPVVPPQAGEQALFDGLESFRDDIEQRFDCVVRFKPVPMPRTAAP